MYVYFVTYLPFLNRIGQKAKMESHCFCGNPKEGRLDLRDRAHDQRKE